MDISLKQKQVIDFIVNDVAFKLNKEMIINSIDDIDIFIDKSHFKLKILSFIIFKIENPAETCICDYRPDDDTLNYFVNLSHAEIAVIEQRILNKIKGCEDESEKVQSPQPPDGWRWLNRGEVIRRGDRKKDGDTVPLFWINTPCAGDKFIMRRNKFELGEKVVAKDSNKIWEVDSIINDVYKLRSGNVFLGFFPEHLAPYIEEANHVRRSS